MYVHVCCTCAHMYMYMYCVHAHLHVHVCVILFSLLLFLFLFLLPSLGYPGYSGPSYGNTQLKCLSLSLSPHHSFPSDPYPEGFRASPDFRPDVFNTYHGQEVHHRGSSPPPWFVREGDMVTSNLHAVSDQVHVQYTYSTCTCTVHIQYMYDIYTFHFMLQWCTDCVVHVHCMCTYYLIPYMYLQDRGEGVFIPEEDGVDAQVVFFVL